MENLRKHYPDMFRRKEVIVTPKPPHKVVWHDNIPIIKDCGSHYEIRKSDHSSPLILSKNYKI